MFNFLNLYLNLDLNFELELVVFCRWQVRGGRHHAVLHGQPPAAPRDVLRRLGAAYLRGIHQEDGQSPPRPPSWAILYCNRGGSIKKMVRAPNPPPAPDASRELNSTPQTCNALKGGVSNRGVCNVVEGDPSRRWSVSPLPPCPLLTRRWSFAESPPSCTVKEPCVLFTLYGVENTRSLFVCFLFFPFFLSQIGRYSFPRTPSQVFLFFKSEEYPAISKEFIPLFREFKGQVIFIYINGSDSQMDNVREFFGIEPEDKLVRRPHCPILWPPVCPQSTPCPPPGPCPPQLYPRALAGVGVVWDRARGQAGEAPSLSNSPGPCLPLVRSLSTLCPPPGARLP